MYYIRACLCALLEHFSKLLKIDLKNTNKWDVAKQNNVDTKYPRIYCIQYNI